MEHEIISAFEFCKHYHIEYEFISSLEESGLIKTTRLDDKAFIDYDQITLIEKFARLYYELDISLHGIEAIMPLLEKMRMMQNEILELKARLRIYED